MCERWDNFSNFVADMGPRPSGKTLDRRNNDGHYEPTNCRWATPAQQAANQRKTLLSMWLGEMRPLNVIAKMESLRGGALWHRVCRMNENVQDAVAHLKDKRANTAYYEFDGKRMTIRQIARATNVTYYRLWRRLHDLKEPLAVALNKLQHTANA